MKIKYLKHIKIGLKNVFKSKSCRVIIKKIKENTVQRTTLLDFNKYFKIIVLL